MQPLRPRELRDHSSYLEIEQRIQSVDDGTLFSPVSTELVEDELRKEVERFIASELWLSWEITQFEVGFLYRSILRNARMKSTAEFKELVEEDEASGFFDEAVDELMAFQGIEGCA